MIARNYKAEKKSGRYRAVVIDAKKLLRAAVLILAAVIIGAVIASAPGAQQGEADIPEEPETAQHGTAAAEHVLSSLKKLSVLILGFDPYTATGIVAAEAPGADTVNSYAIVKEAADNSEASPSPPPTPAPSPQQYDENSLEIRAINAAQNAKSDSYQIRIGNQTSYGVDVNALLAEPLDFDMSGDGPKILILHTHATEAYSPEGAERYNSGESDRSMDTDENVVAVGTAAAQVFEEHGIKTLHDTELHDYPSFNGSYGHALSSAEDYIAKYPSIRIVLDIHRDSIVYDDGTKAKPVTEINGQNAAQLMFVVGTNEKGLYHPEWRENLKFAVKLQDRIDGKYPELMRYINLRQERFNGHTTKGSLIIEVGSSGNTLSEAKLGITCAAECIAEFLNELK
ncbi:MAG TPA: stage II sporulation protein P [Candidatus Monoglobus merdigallinarum]|uniref:Stage II sporulation protein P n=1 Tax=Candidatus Monoglobus merdigallinarum TaxID=2838698 RepID=A0A9D1TKZ1_9FIRM|nr:stage II sporulation protein P [Candidatus Monoglobus merdigallinarum]